MKSRLQCYMGWLGWKANFWCLTISWAAPSLLSAGKHHHCYQLGSCQRAGGLLGAGAERHPRRWAGGAEGSSAISTWLYRCLLFSGSGKYTDHLHCWQMCRSNQALGRSSGSLEAVDAGCVYYHVSYNKKSRLFVAYFSFPRQVVSSEPDRITQNRS